LESYNLQAVDGMIKLMIAYECQEQDLVQLLHDFQVQVASQLNKLQSQIYTIAESLHDE
jgi:hypothetical protein